MADYSIQLGVQLDTKNIDSTISKYKTKPIEFTAKLNTGNIDDKIRSYVAKKQIEVTAKLNTSKIDERIRSYTAKKQIELTAKLDTKHIDKAISSYQSKSPINVNVKLNQSSINEQLKSYKSNGYIEVNAKLKKDAIDEQIRNYQTKVPIKVNVQLNNEDIDQKIGKYEVRSPLRVKVKIDKTDINHQIKQFDGNEQYISVKARLDNGAISEAIRSYKATTPIKVALELDASDIGKKIASVKSSYKSIELPVKLTPDKSDINQKIRSIKPTTPIMLSAQLSANDIDNVISSYKAKTPVKIGAILDNKIISSQIRSFKADAPIELVAKLRDDSINQAIASYKTGVPINVHVNLLTEDIDNQISAYQAKLPIKIGVQLDDNKIREQIGNQRIQTAIKADVKLDTKDIVAQIKNYKTSSFIKVGVKLDTKQINEQVRAFKTRSSIKVGVKLDSTGISKQIKAINSKTPVKVSLKIDTTDAKKKINDIKNRLKQLGNVRINFGIAGNVGNAGSQNALGGAKQVTSELNKIKMLSREIGKLDFKMNTLDANANVNQIKELGRQLELLKTQYNETAKVLNQGGISGISSVTSKEFVDARNKLAEFDAKLTDTKNNLAQGITANFGNYDASLLSLQNRFDMLADKPAEVKMAIEKVGTALNELKSADGTEDIIAKNERYKEVLHQVEMQLKNLELIENGANYQDRLSAEKESAMRKLNSLYSQGSAAAKKYGSEVSRLKRELNSCGNIKGVQSIVKQINALGIEIKNSHIQTQTFGERMENQFSKYSSYLSVYSLIMYSYRALRDMFNQVVAVDTAMTELKKVTDETNSSYNKFLSNAATRSKELGTTIDGLVNSTADFARLGYSFKESQGLAEVANIYAVVGDEVESVDEATQSLVSTMAAFKDEMGDVSDSEFAMSIVDKMNEVSNNYAISSGGIGSALQRSASSMAAANNTIDETIALITAANEVAQDPEKVGNAMKTISMRIRGAKTE